MPSRRAPFFLALFVGLAVGLVYPYVDRALACRKPQSEACVWAKAYFPLTVGLSLVLLGGASAGAVYGFLAWRRKSKQEDDLP